MARRLRSDGSVELRAAPSVPAWCAAAIAIALGLVAQSCVEKGDTNVNSSGTGGGGAGGAGGTGASSGTGGSAGGDASNCLGDTGASVDCATLPYAAESCDGGSPPQGVETCKTAQAKLRAGVVSDLFGCLSTLAPGAMQDPCSSSHIEGATQCVAQSTGKACEAPDTAAVCAAVTCDPDCTGHLNSLTPAARTAFKSCFSDRTTSGADCGTAFNDCYPM
ncbi:MAG: hypothetical protein HYZ29_18080 [Myxococcales bacterium]|nr:hypothetical protein [Myxococcales bacterium]